MLQHQLELFIVTAGRKEFSFSLCPVEIISFFISDKKMCHLLLPPSNPIFLQGDAGGDNDKIAILAHLQEGISAFDFH